MHPLRNEKRVLSVRKKNIKLLNINAISMRADLTSFRMWDQRKAASFRLSPHLLNWQEFFKLLSRGKIAGATSSLETTFCTRQFLEIK